MPYVKDKVEIIQGPISREKMSEYMGRSDLLVDQFNSGSFTRMAIEAFKFGIPILINIDENIHRELHGESPPVVNATTSDEIFIKLKELSDSKDVLQKIANDAKIWYEKYYELEKEKIKSDKDLIKKIMYKPYFKLPYISKVGKVRNSLIAFLEKISFRFI